MSEPSPAEEPRDSLEKKKIIQITFGNIVWHIKHFQEFRLVNYRRLILDVMTEGDNSHNNNNNNNNNHNNNNSNNNNNNNSNNNNNNNNNNVFMCRF